MATVERMFGHHAGKHAPSETTLIRAVGPILSTLAALSLLGFLVAGGDEPESLAEPPQVAVVPLDHSRADRVDQAEDASRAAAREDRLWEAKQERIAERQEARQLARQDAREEARVAAAAEAAREEEREEPAVSQSSGSTGGMPSLLVTIRAHESGGNYSAFNAGGCEGYGCGGAYQMHARYAAEWAARAGYPGLSGQAQTWPPATQDAVALHLFYSTNPDGAHWCNWVDYC